MGKPILERIVNRQNLIIKEIKDAQGKIRHPHSLATQESGHRQLEKLIYDLEESNRNFMGFKPDGPF